MKIEFTSDKPFSNGIKGKIKNHFWNFLTWFFSYFPIYFDSKLDIHVMQYCLAINTHSNQETFCNAIDNVIGKSPKLFCTRLKATLNNYFFRPVERISNIGNWSNVHQFELHDWKEIISLFFNRFKTWNGTSLYWPTQQANSCRFSSKYTILCGCVWYS